jgi:hypothetical protein
MSQALRDEFNARWTPGKYQRFLQLIDQRSGTHVGFRNSETPCFFDSEFLERMARSGEELIRQLVESPAYRLASDAALPPQYNVPNESPAPMFVQVDFGVVRDEHGVNHPKLVEIQGFPSLYAYQPALCQAYIDAYELDPMLRYFFSGLDRQKYDALLRTAIVGLHDPAEVILMEIDPRRQKTLCDFNLTEQALGVRPVCITRLTKKGNRLYYDRDGRQVRIKRIYNRTIIDELERKGVRAPFDWRDDLEVEWAGHPNWYFRISKFSIPYLRHPCVPQTLFLDQVAELPADLENWVLKPLYSFAGLGVSIGPSKGEVDAVPAAERRNWILQERVRFTPTIETPHGLTQAEIRIMYIWTDTLRPVCNIIRMGRGKMMGVDHNKNFEWVGASAALFY